MKIIKSLKDKMKFCIARVVRCFRDHGWVKVKYNPLKNGKYIVLVNTLGYESGIDVSSYVNGEWGLNYVTHWRVLPKSPKR